MQTPIQNHATSLQNPFHNFAISHAPAQIFAYRRGYMSNSNERTPYLWSLLLLLLYNTVPLFIYIRYVLRIMIYPRHLSLDVASQFVAIDVGIRRDSRSMDFDRTFGVVLPVILTKLQRRLLSEYSVQDRRKLMEAVR